MKINTPISVGELVDKITILKIKSEFITDKEKLSNILFELKNLNDVYKTINVDLTELESNLYDVNKCLWEIEDNIRIKEKKKDFDGVFIALARDVYQTNDKRFELKNKINQLTNSSIKEEKSYESYS
jgi:hypothetical protein